MSSDPPGPVSRAFSASAPPRKGVIFQTNKDGSLPPHVMYKIRQNSSFTEKTNEIRRAYWRPGPNTGGRFYFLYGFVWIQGEPSWGKAPSSLSGFQEPLLGLASLVLASLTPGDV